MKILMRAPKERAKRFYNLDSLPPSWELVWAGFERDTEKLLALAGDAEAMFVDAVEPAPAVLIEGMPKLRIIQSEGVGFEQIDIAAAAKRGVFVCNNKGANAKAVAEQAVMLMLAVLRRTVEGDRMVRAGRQIEAKSQWIMEGVRELGGLQVGLVGMGDIARETVTLLHAFGAQVSYYNRTRLSPAQEEEAGIAYLPVDELLAGCDIISLHIAANAETKNFMNRQRFALMKKDGILINTARGEIVNQQDLLWAIETGQIGGAGLDCLTPEPVTPDNEMLQIAPEWQHKITFAPHIGGVTVGAFRRMHAAAWANMRAVAGGQRPINIVNGL